jgi:hypothetical protein
MRQDVTGANTALSFIDVLASALGAAVLRFVILASSPASVTTRAQACGTFIRYGWNIKSDPGALLRIVVSSPFPKLTELENFAGQAVQKFGLNGVSSYLVMGFARDADETRGGQVKDRTYVLRLNQPGAADWKVGILYYDRVNTLSSAPPVVRLTHTVSHDSNAGLTSELSKLDAYGKGPLAVTLSQDGTLSLEYGETLFSRTVTEKSNRAANSGCDGTSA